MRSEQTDYMSICSILRVSLLQTRDIFVTLPILVLLSYKTHRVLQQCAGIYFVSLHLFFAHLLARISFSLFMLAAFACTPSYKKKKITFFTHNPPSKIKESKFRLDNGRQDRKRKKLHGTYQWIKHSELTKIPPYETTRTERKNITENTENSAAT